MDEGANRMESDSGGASSEFYVPYLPVAPSQKRFLRVLVPVVLWTLVGISLLIAYSQRSPGSGRWETGTAVTFHGTVEAEPYPALMTADRGDGRPGMLLLVEVGKRSGGQRAIPFHKRAVEVSGWPLHRDGRWILELEPGAEGIRASAELMPVPPIVLRSLGRVTLRGEIVDSKCFLGAMKPGEGKTHKECATLCISGGIPPMLVTRDAAGVATFYLLLGETGGPLSADAYPFIADAVEITGECEEQGDVRRLRVRVGDIHRL